MVSKPSYQSNPVRAWRQWIEPWYLVYALLGAVAAGLIPVLLPLIASKDGSAAQVGLVVAAVSLHRGWSAALVHGSSLRSSSMKPPPSRAS